MEIDKTAIHEVILQTAIDEVVADEKVLMDCMKAQLELQKLIAMVEEARQEAAAALMAVSAIKDADEALSEINKTKECMQRIIGNLEKVNEQKMVVGARAGVAMAAVQRAGDRLIEMGIDNNDMRIKPLHMWYNAVLVSWEMVYDRNWVDITGTVEMVKYELECAMASAEEADILHNMIYVVNDMDKALGGLQRVVENAVRWRAAAEKAARAAGWKNWVEGLSNYYKRQRIRGGKRKSKKSKKSKRSRRGKKQIKKTKKYKKRSNKKRSNKK